MAVEREIKPTRIVAANGDVLVTGYLGSDKVTAKLLWDPTKAGHSTEIRDMTVQQAKDLHLSLGEYLKELE